MADTKISAMGNAGPVQATDILPIVQNVPSTPTNQKVTFQNLINALFSGITLSAGKPINIQDSSGSKIYSSGGLIEIQGNNAGNPNTIAATGAGSILLTDSFGTMLSLDAAGNISISIKINGFTSFTGTLAAAIAAGKSVSNGLILN
jgi:hypothetical protein